MTTRCNGASHESAAFSTSRRIQSTDEPTIVASKRLVTSVPGTMSLAQGIVHWQPPQQALDRVAQALADPTTTAIHSYGPDEGNPALRESLRHKLVNKNNLPNYDVCVTAGANQAFTNIVLAFLDPEDAIVLWLPYYFNHQMSIQMCGGADSIIYGPCDPVNFHPNLDWLEELLSESDNIAYNNINSSNGGKEMKKKPKMVVITNPCNPTGVLLSKEELDRAAALCAKAGVWLVLDNTYEEFVYDGREHYCPAGENVLHLFSFSKAYGMMGWRVGYIAYPEDGSGHIASELLKVQDTIPICVVQISQQAALGALEAGSPWVNEQVQGLDVNKQVILDALKPVGTLGNGIAGGEGAIYLWAKLPKGCENDTLVVEWLVKKHKVSLIPGTACGCPGHVRIGFANMEPVACAAAAERLKAGMLELAEHGMAIVEKQLA
jgi:aromatic aminotransferase